MVALAILFGFYVSGLFLVLALLAFPVIAALTLRFNFRLLLFVFPMCWLPAFMIARGVFGARPPRVVLRGRELTESDAPKLFLALEDLSAKAETRAPDRVFIVPEFNAAVVEASGERIVQIGAPLLAAFSERQLRAVLAHELGHFVGGDTKLSGVLSFVEATFRSTLRSVSSHSWEQDGSAGITVGFQVADALGKAFVQTWAKLYFSITRATSREQELAADRLAARLTSADAMRSALEKTAKLAPLYDRYLDEDVAFAIKSGAAPLDLDAGFQVFCDRVSADPRTTAFLQHLRATQSPYDSHPSVAERVRRLSEIDAAPFEGGEPATRLIELEPKAFAHWRAVATRSMFGDEAAKATVMEWAQIGQKVHGPRIVEAAKKRRASLQRRFPEATTTPSMLAAVVAAFEGGAAYEIVTKLEPRLTHVNERERLVAVARVAGEVVTALFEAALLERGATIEASIGESALAFKLDGALVRPAELAFLSMQDASKRAELTTWLDRLARP